MPRVSHGTLTDTQARGRTSVAFLLGDMADTSWIDGVGSNNVDDMCGSKGHCCVGDVENSISTSTSTAETAALGLFVLGLSSFDGTASTILLFCLAQDRRYPLVCSYHLLPMPRRTCEQKRVNVAHLSDSETSKSDAACSTSRTPAYFHLEEASLKG